MKQSEHSGKEQKVGAGRVKQKGDGGDVNRQKRKEWNDLSLHK